MTMCTLSIDNKGLIETIELHQEEIKRIDKSILQSLQNYLVNHTQKSFLYLLLDDI